MHSLLLQYIRNSHVVLLVFCNIQTLEVIKNRWYTFYKKNANIPKILYYAPLTINCLNIYNYFFHLKKLLLIF